MLSSCGRFFEKPLSLPFQVLKFPNSDYGTLLWVDGQLVAIIAAWHPSKIEDNQYAIENKQDFYQMELPDYQSEYCLDKPEYHVVDGLSNTKALVWMDCLIDRETSTTYVMEYDWNDHTLHKLLGPVQTELSGITWNPEMTRGIAYLDRYDSGTLANVSSGALGPLDWIIKADGKLWHMKDDFPDFQGSDKGLTGTASQVAWSPDGKKIVFFGSLEPIGIKGSDHKYSVSYKLYVADPDGASIFALADGIQSPHLLEWSPDSKSIAFIAGDNVFQTEGIWLYSFAERSLKNIAPGQFQDILWDEDGKSINAIRCTERIKCSEIIKYDLSGILIP